MRIDAVLMAYTARRTKGGKAAWTRIGEAYPFDDGAWLTVKLVSIPLDGIVILLERDTVDDDCSAQEAASRRPAEID